jgi:hypothetical protein
MSTSLGSLLDGHQPIGVPIDTGDGRILSAVYYNGKLVDAFNDNCNRNPESTNLPQAYARIQEIDVNHKAVLLDTKLTPNAKDVDTYYPVVTMTRDGRVFFAFGGSSPILPPAVYAGYFDIDSSDVKRLQNGSTSVRLGLANSDSEERFGDHSGMATDPDGRSAWIALEYGKSRISCDDNNIKCQWSTLIARILKQ